MEQHFYVSVCISVVHQIVLTIPVNVSLTASPSFKSTFAIFNFLSEAVENCLLNNTKQLQILGARTYTSISLNLLTNTKQNGGKHLTGY